MFSADHAEALVREVGQEPMPGYGPAWFAEYLNRAAGMLLYGHAMDRAVSGAKQREEWARDVGKHAGALLAAFGLEPDGTTPGPSPHGIAVLLHSDIDGDDWPLTGGGAALWRRRWNDTRREAWRLRRAMVPQGESLERSAALGWDHPGPGAPDHREAVRSAIMGVAFIATHAAFAEAFYANRRKHPRRFTHRNTYFLCLAMIYREAFGEEPTYTTPVDGDRTEPSGPIISFCQAASRRIREYVADGKAGAHVRAALRQQLDSWANRPGTVVTALLDVDCIDAERDVWRRPRDGGKRSKGQS